MRRKKSWGIRNICTSLLITLLMMCSLLLPKYAEHIYAVGAYAYTIGADSVLVYNTQTDREGPSIYTSCQNVDQRITDYQNMATAASGDTKDMYLTYVAGFRAFKNNKCGGTACDPMVGWTSSGFSVNGIPVGRISRNGQDMFCLDPHKYIYGYNCTENWGAPIDGTGRFSNDQLIRIAKIINAYDQAGSSYYDQAQVLIWDVIEGGGYADKIDTSGLRSVMDSLDTSNYRVHRPNMTGTPSGELGATFTMTDSNNELGSGKFSVGSTSGGITVTQNGNSTTNTITQPYPITKTVNINGSSADRRSVGDASITLYPAKLDKAQSFAYFGRYASNTVVDEYPSTSYSVSYPTGTLSFQKQDTNGRNVSANYCQETGLCALGGDPVNNVFRLLIDGDSQYWNTNADTGKEVEVEGKTYHVFQMENGTTTFKTDGSGKITVNNLLVGDYYLQEVSTDTRVFIPHSEILSKVTVNRGQTASASMKNENLGVYDFQKKDSFENNVYKDYCKDTHLCVLESADATNNHFRILIDESSANWNGFGDTGEEVSVEGKTYHVYKAPSGDIDFKTDDNGKMTIHLPQGHYYLQETSVDENVFILNEELTEFDIVPAEHSEGSMKNINLFGDFELQKYDEFGNKGLMNTYNTDASGNTFKLKYIDTLGKPVFKGKSFDLPDGKVAVNEEGYLEIDGSSTFTTDADGYFWIGEKFAATNHLCVPFGSWQLEEIATQNEFEISQREGQNPLDIVIEVGEKTHTDYTNDYRDISIKLFKQDKANQVRVPGATYTLYDIDKYNIGNPDKGAGNLYEGSDAEIFNSVKKGDEVNFYDEFVGTQDGKYPDYNYVYEFETNGEDDKVADDKYVQLSANDETLSGISSGLTRVKVYKQTKDLYGTLQDRYFYIGDHSFDPMENINFYLDEAGTIPVNIREISYTITGEVTKTEETVVSADAAMTYGQYLLYKEGLDVSGLVITLPEADEEGNIAEDTEVTVDFSAENYETEYETLKSVMGEDAPELHLEKETNTITETVSKDSIEDCWDEEGVYTLTYTVISEARQKWTFERKVTYEDDHEQVCEYNAVLNQYVWGDSKEICKELDNENPQVKRAPEEYDYDSRTVTYDASKIIQLVKGDEEKDYLSDFELWCIDKDSKPEFARAEVANTGHYYKLGEYVTDENGEVSIEGLKHSRTYMVCETGLPEGYTYDETENVCFVVEGNYESGREVKVNTKNNELTQILIRTTAEYEDGSREAEFTDGSLSITDHVTVIGLDTNGEYVLRTDLISKADGTVVDSKVSEFTTSGGTKKALIDVEGLSVTPSKNIDQDYVVFEYLWRKEDFTNKEDISSTIAEHTDINDEGQTVKVREHTVEIRTKALVDGVKEKENDFSLNTVTDTVRYTNAFVGKETVMKASLIDADTQTAISTGEVTFVPETADGEIEVTMTFVQGKNADKRYVVFEEMYLSFLSSDTPIAEHKDLSDEEQTVTLKEREMEMGTTVSKKDIHIGKDSTIVEFTDTVSYKGLPEGKTYELKGYLVDKNTGKEVILNGKRVEAAAEFTAETGDGTAEVAFRFDAAINENNWLSDGEYVVFEELYIKEKGNTSKTPILEHKDIRDEGQTFRFTDDYRYYRFKKTETPDVPKKPEVPYKPVNTRISR